MFSIFNKRLVFGFFLIQPFLGASFYFYEIGLAPAPMVAAFFSIFYLCWERKGSGLKPAEENILKLFSAYLVVLLSMSVAVSAVYILFEGYSFRPHGLIGIIVGGVSLVALDRYATAAPDKFVFNLRFFLIVNLCFFYIQFFGFFVFGYEVDYMVGVTGEAQRLIGYSREVEGVGAFRRSSGLFAEPAVYANFTIAVLVGLLYLKKCSFSLFLLAISSILLSFSSTGFALSVFPLIIALRNSARTRAFVVTLFFVAFFLYSDLFLKVFGNEISRVTAGLGDESGASRLWFVDYIFSNPIIALGGFGVFVDLRDVVPPSLFISSAIYSFGLPGFVFLLILFLAFFVNKFDSIGLFCLIVLGLLVNYSVSSPFFWFIFSVLFVCLKRGRAGI